MSKNNKNELLMGIDTHQPELMKELEGLHLGDILKVSGQHPTKFAYAKRIKVKVGGGLKKFIALYNPQDQVICYFSLCYTVLIDDQMKVVDVERLRRHLYLVR